MTLRYLVFLTLFFSLRGAFAQTIIFNDCWETDPVNLVYQSGTNDYRGASAKTTYRLYYAVDRWIMEYHETENAYYNITSNSTIPPSSARASSIGSTNGWKNGVDGCGISNQDPTDLTLTILQAAPTVTSVTSSTTNGTYKIGGAIVIQVSFSANVMVTGTPQLTLETGATDRSISYASGSGTSTLTFSYTVQAGDISSDLDYIGTTALALNGGTIKDAAGNAATLTLASPGAANSIGNNKAIVVDGVVPTVSSVTSPTGDAIYKTGNTINIQVNFSENVIVTGTPQLTLETGETDRVVDYTTGTGTSILYFSYVVQAGDVSADLDYISTSALSLNGGAIKDAAGNNATLTLASPGASSSLGANKNIAMDTQAPSLTITSNMSALRTGSVATITFTFSEAPLDFNIADIVLSGGNQSSFRLTANPLVYTLLFTPSASFTGNGSVSVAPSTYTDAGGNLGSGHRVDMTIDTQAPSTYVNNLAISNDTGSSSSDFITNTAAQTFSGSLSAPLALGEQVIYSFNGIAFHVATSVVGNTTWSFAATLFGTTTVYVLVVDAAGNRSSPLNQYIVTDQVAPTVAISSDQLSLKAGETATITLTFSEEIVEFTLSDFSYSGGTLSNLMATANPRVYEVSYTPSAGYSGNGNVAISAGSYIDFAGNSGNGGSSPTISIDTQRPVAPLLITPVNGSTVTNNKPTITGTAETGTTISIYIDAAYVNSTTVDAGGNWTFTLSAALATGSHTVRATATDAAGNVSANSNTNNFTVTTVLPVNLLSFTAKTENKVAKLHWQTASEQNNKSFDIYRSGDDKQFVKLDEVAGQGTSNTINTYYFTDRQPLQGNNYYRLVQVDLDGKTTLLGDRNLNFELLVADVNAYPNPAHNQVNISFPLGYQKLVLSGLDGRVLKQLNLSASQTTAVLDLANYAKGLYIVKLVSSHHEEVIKVIKL